MALLAANDEFASFRMAANRDLCKARSTQAANSGTPGAFVRHWTMSGMSDTALQMIDRFMKGASNATND